MLIFLALSLLALVVVSTAFHFIAPWFFKQHHAFSPSLVIVNETLSLLGLLFTLLIIGRVEHRSIGSYGLPLRRAFRDTFWVGAVLGFVSLTALLMAIRGLHGFYFGPVALSGRALLHYAVLWAIAFLMVALWEEYVFRGYSQFVLTRGMGFWWAAIVTSLLFGLVHATNRACRQSDISSTPTFRDQPGSPAARWDLKPACWFFRFSDWQRWLWHGFIRIQSTRSLKLQSHLQAPVRLRL